MPNALTGEFDVVAQFAAGAVNRVLAAMHQRGRFPHSIAIRVDDNRPPGRELRPAIVGIVSSFGDPIANQQKIGRPTIVAGELPSSTTAWPALDAVVNAGMLEDIQAEPSNLQGRAQIQLFPPTIELDDSSGSTVAIRLELIARYFPDPNTTPIAEFVRGVLRVTAPVSQVASQVANIIKIDIKAASVGVSFTPSWSSKPFSGADVTALNQLIRNALKTSFLPSTSELPQGVSHMQFKTMSGATKAIAVLLDMDGTPGDRASANNLFLSGGDDFAIGVGADFVRAAFQPTLDEVLTTPIEPMRFTFSIYLKSWTVTYNFKLNSAAVELENGKIVLVVKGRGTTSSWTPNFDFTAKLSFSLEVNGDSADLVAGDVSIDTSSWIIDRFRGMATSAIRRARDTALAAGGARASVRKMLSAEGNLGGFIDSLLQPARQGPEPPMPKGFELGYTSVAISPEGIVLHGALAIIYRLAPHVEFEKIPTDAGGRFDAGVNSVYDGPDYSALKSWIPGGTIERYEWKKFGQIQPGYSDANKFVLLYQPPGATTEVGSAVPIAGYAPLCLTVHGRRLTVSGPVVEHSVTATACAFDSFPILDSVAVLGAEVPTIALARPGNRGLVEVSGHTIARVAEAGRVPPNLIVHFGTLRTASNLVPLIDALRMSGRADAPTAILAVLPADDLENVTFTPDVIYSEDQNGVWERQLGVTITTRPATLVVSPHGQVLHQHDGEINAAPFSEVLARLLVPGGRIKPVLKAPSLRIGSPPPNFLFPAGRDHEETLRKIAGRAVTLVFWRTSSKQSIELVDEIQARDGIVLAINDGDQPEIARRLATERNWSAIVVPDPSRRISMAYGVNAWPTTIQVDERGVVAALSVGRTSPVEKGVTSHD